MRRLRRLYDVVAAWWERSFERVEEGVLMRICRRMSWQSIFAITIALAILRKLISLWRNNSSAVSMRRSFKKSHLGTAYIYTESDQHRTHFQEVAMLAYIMTFLILHLLFCIFWSISFMLLGRILKKFKTLVIYKWSNSLANRIKKCMFFWGPELFFQILLLKP